VSNENKARLLVVSPVSYCLLTFSFPIPNFPCRGLYQCYCGLAGERSTAFSTVTLVYTKYQILLKLRPDGLTETNEGGVSRALITHP